jgi:hypothetical protein
LIQQVLICFQFSIIFWSWSSPNNFRSVSTKTSTAVISRSAGDEAVLWTTTLAIVLHEQGRHEEAAVMRETILDSEERAYGVCDGRVGMNELFLLHLVCINCASLQAKQWAISPPRIWNSDDTRKLWSCRRRHSNCRGIWSQLIQRF